MILSSYFLQKHKLAKVAVLSLFLGTLALTACNAGEGESSVSLLMDGAVKATIVEDFDKSYYDKDELQQMILEEVVSYNRQLGEDAVSVDKVSVENGVARVEMTYADSESYAAFNDGVFFLGPVSEAQKAGYDLNKVFISSSDQLVTAGMSDILEMSDAKILITDMKEPVVLDGKAVYVSSNVETDKKCKTVSFDETSDEMAYIIYK